MKQIDRTKVCWSCEADVNDQATYCPFCGTDLLHKPADSAPLFSQHKDPKFSEQPLEESLASLYKPPYSVRNRQGLGIPDERAQTPYQANKQEKPFPNPEERMDPFAGKDMSDKGTVLSFLFLMIGSHLLVLGSLLFCCSKEGILTLEWRDRFWFLYVGMGCPLLYFGIKRLKNQKN